MSITQTELILPLDSLSRDDVAQAGSKAANLGDLLQAGHAVPDGFVLTTEAFDAFVRQHSLASDATFDAVAAAALPETVADALCEAVVHLDGTPLAVRSSGVAEDLAGASFAGQYETVLNVRGVDALLDAVKTCWASAFSEQVASYRMAQRIDSVPPMAVLVQRLVEADAAGVAFTANPVTGDRGEAVVSAVRGLGDRLVSGQATPDEWLVNGNEAVCQASPEGAIDEAQALAVAALARAAETHFGTPQDIEWAVAGGELFLLQSRPITTLSDDDIVPVPVPVVVPEGNWQREASHAPLPRSPANRSMFFSSRTEATKYWLDDFGLLMESIGFEEIGGWEYIRMVPLGGKDRRPPPAFLIPLLIRVVPMMRSRIKQCVQAIRGNKAGQLVDQWYDEWLPMLEGRIGQLRDVDLESLTDDALDQHIRGMVAFLDEAIIIHARLHGAEMAAVADVAFTCRDLLGWTEDKAFGMFSGLSHKSTEPARRLAELAQMASSRPSIMALLEHIDGETVGKLSEADPKFGTAFAEYQHTYGCRALRYEIADLTLAESPEMVLGLINTQTKWDYDPVADAKALEDGRNALVAEAQAALADAPTADQERFERALETGQKAYPVREDNEFFTISAPFALARYGFLEAGRRLAERGQIAQRDDVFYLEYPEALAAVKSGENQDGLVRHRKGEEKWVFAHPGPAFYGKVMDVEPSFKGFPPEVQFAHESLMWTIDRIMGEGSTQKQGSGDELTGIAASPGTYTGPVRVVMDESEFGKIQPGDVLVCPVTSPVWSVLFPNIGALVTDTGGILSHPAIIAREYRVPGVVATGNGTELLEDGQMVEVDGTQGTVRLV